MSEVIPEIRKFSSLPIHPIEKNECSKKQPQGANLWGLPAARGAPANPVLKVRPALDRRAVPDHQAAAIMVEADHIAARAARAKLEDPRAAELGLFLAAGRPDGAPSRMGRLEAVRRRIGIAKAQGRHYGECGRQEALTGEISGFVIGPRHVRLFRLKKLVLENGFPFSHSIFIAKENGGAIQ